MAEWAAKATGATVTLIEENGTAHTYAGPSADAPVLRLRRRGGDFVPLLLRTPAPAPAPTVPLAEEEEEAFGLSTLSGADAEVNTAEASDMEMDLDSDSEPEEAAVRTGPETPYAAELATLLSEPQLRFPAVLDTVRRRNAQLGGFPDVAFDSAFTEHAGIGLPEALDQAEQEGRLQPEEYEELRETLGLGTDGPFRQTHPSGSSERDRQVTLRMLDRVARLVKEVLRKEDRQADAQVTPHIAVGLLPDGSLGIAGNTGAKALTRAEAALVEEELRWFVTGQEPEGTPRQRKLEQWTRDEESHRQWSAQLEQWQQDLDDNGATDQERRALAADRRKWQGDERWLARRRPAMAREMRDRTKLRALATGWYRLYHPDSPELDLVQRALASPRILNIDGLDAPTGSYGSEHGELTLLGHWVAHWESHPGDPAAPRTLHLGGFKMACASCDLAYQAVNERLGPALGHRVRAAGTHGMFFPGWRMPQWMRQRPELWAYIRDNAEDIGAYLDANGVLQGDRTTNGHPQNPAESESEYASGEEDEEGRPRSPRPAQGNPR